MKNTEKKTVFDYLKDYGIDVEKIIDDKVDDLLKKGYEKVPDEAKEAIDAMLQYIPGLAVEAIVSRDAISKSKKLLDGAFKVSITDGMHLAKSKASKNAFRGTLLANANNQIAGQAELFKIEDSLKLIQAPRYALCVFDAVSAVTGQYYMAEINHKLASIEDKTDRILGYLENNTRGELWSNDQILNEVIRNIDHIKTNEIQKTAYYQQVLSIKKDALAKMMLFDLQINSSKRKIDTKSKAEDIEKFTEIIAEYYPQYWFTIYLYAKSVFCEIALAEIDDPILLNNMKDEILNFVKKYRSAFDKDRVELSNIVKNAKALNLKKIPKLGIGNHMYGQNNIFIALLQLYDVVAGAENLVADSKEAKKKSILKRINSEMEDLGDVEVLIDQTKRIENHLLKVSGPVEVVKIGDDVLIKYNDGNKDGLN